MVVGKFDIANALKGSEWQRAKGHLMALVEIQGSYHAGCSGWEYERVKELKVIIDEFVSNVESNGLHE